MTANIADFSPLAKVWADEERSHAGIVLVPPSRSSVGRLLRGLKILATSRDTLINCVVFLPYSGPGAGFAPWRITWIAVSGRSSSSRSSSRPLCHHTLRAPRPRGQQATVDDRLGFQPGEYLPPRLQAMALEDPGNPEALTCHPPPAGLLAPRCVSASPGG